MVISHINTKGTGPAKLPKPCHYCGSIAHRPFGCRKRPKKPLKRSPLQKTGKLAKAYGMLREQYLEANPGPWFCYYCLHMGIEQELIRRDVNVEHYHSKARRPDLRFKMGNLVVSCAFHNKDKGSLDGDTYLKKIEDRNAKR